MLSLISKYGLNPLTKVEFSKLFNMSDKQISDLLDSQSKVIEINFKNYNWIITDFQNNNNKNIILSLVKDFHEK